jgi:Ca2+-transporting ATPase
VTATGEGTELGSIARLASAAKPPATPLQRRLGALSRFMIALGFGVMVILAAGMLLRGASLHEAFLVGVSVAVAAVASRGSVAVDNGHALPQRIERKLEQRAPVGS